MLERLRLLGCNMGLRIRYLHSQLDYFLDNLGGFPVKKMLTVITKMPGTLGCKQDSE